jgi:ATP synthase protein I
MRIIRVLRVADTCPFRGADILKEPESSDDQWRGFFIVSALGADLVACLAGGYFVGRFLGGRFGHETLWTIGGTLTGLAAGIVSVIILLKTFTEGQQ